MSVSKIPTPCAGICSTTFGDTVCRGCRRYLHEVIDWNRYNDDQKSLVWQRLDSLPAHILPRYFRIEDPTLLGRQLENHRIPHRPMSSPWVQLHALLKSAAGQSTDLGMFGVVRLDQRPIGLVELRDEINEGLYTLAQASYDKDFVRAIQGATGTASLSGPDTPAMESDNDS